jgi:hypothetical protein
MGWKIESSSSTDFALNSFRSLSGNLRLKILAKNPYREPSIITNSPTFPPEKETPLQQNRGKRFAAGKWIVTL